MRFSRSIVAIILFSISSIVSAADFIEVEKSIEVSGDVKKVWQEIGGFCAIKDWHPAISECQEYDDHGTYYRNLTLADGGNILEKRKEEVENSYTYFIKKGPLPVKPYKATFMVDGDGSTTKITWKANFKARGASEEEAKSIIEGIFDAGLASLKDKYK